MNFEKLLDKYLSNLVEYVIYDISFIIEEDKSGTGKIKIEMLFNKDLPREEVINRAKIIINDKFGFNDQNSKISIVGLTKSHNWKLTSTIIANLNIIDEFKKWWEIHKDRVKGKIDISFSIEREQQPQKQIVLDPMITTLNETIADNKILNKLKRIWNSYGRSSRLDINFIDRFITNNIDILDASVFKDQQYKKRFRNILNDKIRQSAVYS